MQNESIYYKLYFLRDGKLSSHFGNNDDGILINKAYSASNPAYPLCFSNLEHILDWYVEYFGDIVCNITPLDEVVGQWDINHSSRIEGECRTIIPTNPRYVYSPSFLKLLFENDIYHGLSLIIDEYSINQIIESYDTKDCCCGVPLCFPIESALQLALLQTSSNKKISELLNYRRERFDYKSILKHARKKHIGIRGESIIIEAWNYYNPSFKSKMNNTFISVLGNIFH